MRTLLLLLTVASGYIPAAALAGDAAAGKQKSQACVACHGEGGRSSNPQFPKLAGQVEDYLVQAMQSYKTGRRKNAIMQGMAVPLSQHDIEDLAAYFSGEHGDLFVKY